MSPTLFVVAGPNGAGKIIFSNSIVEVDFEVFDGDRHVAMLMVLYPETGSGILQNSVNEINFRQAKELAIKANGSFAFETNFSSEDPVKSLLEFKAAGFNSHLIFMRMNNIEECIQRVSIRVKAGGHKVSEDSIRYNYINGYKNLYQFYRMFDVVTLRDGSVPEKDKMKTPLKLLQWKNGHIKLFEKQFPAWVEEFIQVNAENFNQK